MAYNLVMRRSRLWFSLWLLGILFPMAWLGRWLPGFERVFTAFFAPEWMHWLMHALLFAGLVFLAALALRLPLSFRSTLFLLSLALLVGLLQEGSQLWAGVQVFRWNSLLDLGVDLLGASLGLLTWRSLECRLAAEVVGE